MVFLKLILKSNINTQNFSVDYMCDKNKNHKGEKIFYKTFERFYLKEKIIDVCNKCGEIIENENIYKCEICYKIYCCSCFIFDEHIKKNIQNIKYINKKCHLHKKELMYYCIKCKKNLCIFCIKNNINENNKENDNNMHKNHNIINYIDLYPSFKQINDLKNKIIEKKKKYKELFISLDEYKQKIINRTEELKQNLLDEINLLEKLFKNVSQSFLSYTYFNNFHNFLNNMKNISNIELNEFYNSFGEKKFEAFIKLVSPHKKEIILSNGILKPQYSLKNGIIEKLNYNTIFSNLNINNQVGLIAYNKKDGLYYFSNTNNYFKEKIYSISISNDEKEIYVCLSKKKIVVIFECDLDKCTMKKSQNIISDELETGKHFNKCIQISKEYVTTTENKMITIWKKDNKNIKGYSMQNKMILESNITDILYINEEYFICSLPHDKQILFFNNQNFAKEKKIGGIDCISSKNCLFLIKDYIVINCEEGIAMISVKTKEFVQYIEEFDGISSDKKICSNNLDCIYIVCEKDGIYNSQINIIKLKIINGCLEIIEEYNNVDIDKDEEIHGIICLNYNDIIIYGKGVYYLEQNN